LGPQGRISDARFAHRRALWESLRFKSAGTCSSYHFSHLIDCQKDVVLDLHRDFFILYERAYGRTRDVHISTKTSDRERCLFMQHMSREMEEKWGAPHDSMVAAITSLMYQVPVSAKAVISQRNKMPRRATVKLPWTKSTTPFQRALLRSRR
jgi:hypothetical protein